MLHGAVSSTGLYSNNLYDQQDPSQITACGMGEQVRIAQNQ